MMLRSNESQCHEFEIWANEHPERSIIVTRPRSFLPSQLFCFTKCHGLVAMPASCWPWWLYKRQPLYLRHNHLRYFIAFIIGHHASWSEPSWFSYHSKWKFYISKSLSSIFWLWGTSHQQQRNIHNKRNSVKFDTTKWIYLKAQCAPLFF